MLSTDAVNHNVHRHHIRRLPSRWMRSPPIHHHFHRQHATRPATWPHMMTRSSMFPLYQPFIKAGISTFSGMHPPTTTNHRHNLPLALTFTTLRYHHIATTTSPQVLRIVTNLSPLCHHYQTGNRHHLDKWYQ